MASLKGEHRVSAMVPIAHAADWFMVVPAVLLLGWLILTTARERASGAAEQEEGERADPD